MDKNSAALLKELQSELAAYQNLQRTCGKLVKHHSELESQLNESKCALNELNLMGPTNEVYELYGPVLVKANLEETRRNVGKRIEYISKELKSSIDTLDNMESNMAKHRETVTKLQQQYHVAATKKYSQQ